MMTSQISSGSFGFNGHIEIKLGSWLNRYLEANRGALPQGLAPHPDQKYTYILTSIRPPDGGGELLTAEVLIKALGIPREEVGLIARDGMAITGTCPLEGPCKLALYPVLIGG